MPPPARNRPPRGTNAPPSTSPAAALLIGPGALAGGGATGARTAATGLAGEAVLTTKAFGAVVDAVDKAIRVGFRDLRRRQREYVVANAVDASPADVAKVMGDEEVRQRAFEQKALLRIRKDARIIADIPDARQRRERMDRLLAREERFLRQRAAASAVRLTRAAEHEALRRTSPRGGYWELSRDVRSHTQDCIAMAGKFWPHAILDQVYPPLHGGCPCRVVSEREALRRGLMDRGDVPTMAVAYQRASGVLTGRVGLAETLRQIEAVRLGLQLVEAQAISFDWRPDLHPRDNAGRFRDTLEKALLGGGRVKILLDPGTEVSFGGGKFRVKKPGQGYYPKFNHQDDAIREALDRSARADRVGSVGGDVSFKSYDAYLESRSILPHEPVDLAGRELSADEIQATIDRLRDEIAMAPEGGPGHRASVPVLRRRLRDYEAKLKNASGEPTKFDPADVPPILRGDGELNATIEREHGRRLREYWREASRQAEEHQKVWSGVNPSNVKLLANGEMVEDLGPSGKVVGRGTPSIFMQKLEHTGASPEESAAGAAVYRADVLNKTTGEVVGVIEHYNRPTPGSRLLVNGKVVADESGYNSAERIVSDLRRRAGMVDIQGTRLKYLRGPKAGQVEDSNIERQRLHGATPSQVARAALGASREEVFADMVADDWGLVQKVGAAVDRGAVRRGARARVEAAREVERLQDVYAAAHKRHDAVMRDVAEPVHGTEEYNRAAGKVLESRRNIREARNALTEARRRAEVVDSDATRETLREARPGYGGGRLSGKPSKSKLTPLLNKATTLLPREWIDGNPRPSLKTVRGRGQFSPYNNQINAREGDASVVLHELTHFAEEHNRRLGRAEQAFWSSRTAGQPLQKLQKLKPGWGYKADEVTKPDRFAEVYVGKFYGDQFMEILTMGVEGVFYDRHRIRATDRDHLRWTLGALALL